MFIISKITQQPFFHHDNEVTKFMINADKVIFFEIILVNKDLYRLIAKMIDGAFVDLKEYDSLEKAERDFDKISAGCFNI